MFNNPQFYPDWYLAADGRTYSATLDSEFKEIINVLLLVRGDTSQGGRHKPRRKGDGKIRPDRFN